MKRQVSDRPACVECRRLHRGCPGHRPCQRCIALGLECVESVDNRTKKARTERRPFQGQQIATPQYYPSAWPEYDATHAHGPFCYGHEQQGQQADWPPGVYDAEAWERALIEPAPQYAGGPFPYYAVEQHAAQPVPIMYKEQVASSPTTSPRSSDITEADSPRLGLDSDFYRCPVPECDHAYRRKGDLKTHVLQRHKDLPELPLLIAKPRSTKLGKPYPCAVAGCPSGFTRKSGLARHLRHKHEDAPESQMWLDLNDQDDDGSSQDSGTPASPDSHSDPAVHSSHAALFQPLLPAFHPQQPHLRQFFF